MTIELTTLADVRNTWALPQLKDAQKAFNKCPNAVNWNNLTRTMLIYQQIEGVANRVGVDKQKLMFDLESNPVGHWGDVICRHTLGMTVADALYKA